jgi:hypothetical protein
MCGSWGAIAGTLRYFADRFGVPRAAIEGTQIPERLLRRYARRGEPDVVFERNRRRAALMVIRKVTYFGFLLERDTEPLPDPFPADLAPAARAGLVNALLAGTTPHPDQARVRRGLERLDFYWRRSGGRLAAADRTEIAALITGQVARVSTWDEFLETRIVLDVEALVPAPVRGPLESLPASVHLFGDRVSLEYAVEQGGGVVRLQLKEGQARRLRAADLPPLDRPVRFTVLRGKREALKADSIAELQRQLSGLPKADRQRLVRGGRRGRRR